MKPLASFWSTLRGLRCRSRPWIRCRRHWAPVPTCRGRPGEPRHTRHGSCGISPSGERGNSAITYFAQQSQSLAMVQKYSKGANQKRRAKEAQYLRKQKWTKRESGSLVGNCQVMAVFEDCKKVCNPLNSMAGRQGFEPWERSHVQRFSRPPHSTTLPPPRFCRSNCGAV